MIVHSPESRSHETAFRIVANVHGEDFMQWSEMTFWAYGELYATAIKMERDAIAEYRRDEHDGNCL
jgi:hypothetical protein